jgi:L,D-peptidoglycan transpeptidase YkuD (ErfK/YbiS/YcfS/YnhG family)
VGTSPNDPTRPQGESKGGSIWLHMDDGKGSAACVTLSEAGMRYLLRTLDPAAHPVVVMGDTAHLAG